MNEAKILNRAARRNHADLFKTLQKTSYKHRLNLNQLKEKVKVLERQQQYDKIDLKLKTDKAKNQKRLLENILNPKAKVLFKTRGFIPQAQQHNKSSVSDLRNTSGSEADKKHRSLSQKQNQNLALNSKEKRTKLKILRLPKELKTVPSQSKQSLSSPLSSPHSKSKLFFRESALERFEQLFGRLADLQQTSKSPTQSNVSIHLRNGSLPQLNAVKPKAQRLWLERGDGTLENRVAAKEKPSQDELHPNAGRSGVGLKKADRDTFRLSKCELDQKEDWCGLFDQLQILYELRCTENYPTTITRQEVLKLQQFGADEVKNFFDQKLKIHGMARKSRAADASVTVKNDSSSLPVPENQPPVDCTTSTRGLQEKSLPRLILLKQHSRRGSDSSQPSVNSSLRLISPQA
jgi:hypothetical protein